VAGDAARLFANGLKRDLEPWLVGPPNHRWAYTQSVSDGAPAQAAEGRQTIPFAKHLIQQQTAILHNHKKFRSVIIIPDVDAV